MALAEGAGRKEDVDPRQTLPDMGLAREVDHLRAEDRIAAFGLGIEEEPLQSVAQAPADGVGQIAQDLRGRSATDEDDLDPLARPLHHELHVAQGAAVGAVRVGGDAGLPNGLSNHAGGLVHQRVMDGAARSVHDPVGARTGRARSWDFGPGPGRPGARGGGGPGPSGDGRGARGARPPRPVLGCVARRRPGASSRRSAGSRGQGGRWGQTSVSATAATLELAASGACRLHGGERRSGRGWLLPWLDAPSFLLLSRAALFDRAEAIRSRARATGSGGLPADESSRSRGAGVGRGRRRLRDGGCLCRSSLLLRWRSSDAGSRPTASAFAILSQPDWQSADAWRALGRPRLFYAVSAGNMDSMINHYTANKKRRNADAYSPGGRIGLRPDRPDGGLCTALSRGLQGRARDRRGRRGVASEDRPLRLLE